MYVYFLQIVSLLVLGVIINNGTESRQKKNRGMMYVLFFVMFFVMAFRDISVGVDTRNYSEMFNSVSRCSISNIINNEGFMDKLLFVLLMKFSSLIFNSYYFFQIIFSVIFCIGVVNYLSKTSNDLFFCGLIFICCGLYLGSFNIQRQMLSTVILMNSLNCWIVKKKRKTFFLLVLACLLHLTSVIFILVYFIHNIVDKHPSIAKILPIVILPFYYYYDTSLAYFSEHVNLYINYMDNHREIQSAGGIMIIWTLLIVLSLYILYFRNNTPSLVKTSAIMALIYVMTNLIGLKFNYFERIGVFFMPSVIIIYEYIFYCFKNRSRAQLYKVGMGISFVFYYYLSFISDQYVYKSFL